MWCRCLQSWSSVKTSKIKVSKLWWWSEKNTRSHELWKRENLDPTQDALGRPCVTPVCLWLSRWGIRRTAGGARRSAFTHSSRRPATPSSPKPCPSYRVRYASLLFIYVTLLLLFYYCSSILLHFNIYIFLYTFFLAHRPSTGTPGGETRPAVCTPSCRRLWTLVTPKRRLSCRVRWPAALWWHHTGRTATTACVLYLEKTGICFLLMKCFQNKNKTWQDAENFSY